MSTEQFAPSALHGTTRPATRIDTLRIRGLSKQFGDLGALRGFDLDMQGGEFISLLGPSGCGKTTALNCIAGLLTPDAGDIEVDGTSILKTPSERRRFGMVFQNYALFPHLTVGRNVAFGLEMQRVPKSQIASRVDEILSLVRLLEHRDKYPAQLSGGQQQRVAIARAVVTEPRLMLMDEPLSNLDAKLRMEMRTEIRRLHQAVGLTTIYVTHDQEEALSLSDRIVLMEHGRIRQVGTPREVYLRPASAYAANFLGARNLLDARVKRVVGGHVEIVTESGVELAGSSSGDLSAGDRAIAAIRPEHILLTPQDQPGTQSLRGVVQTVEFLGQGSEVSIQTGMPLDLIAHSEEEWAHGEPVQVHIPVDRLMVFPIEGTGANAP